MQTLANVSVWVIVLYIAFAIWLMVLSVLMPVAIWRMRRELIQCRRAIEHMASSRIYDEPSADPEIASAHATQSGV